MLIRGTHHLLHWLFGIFVVYLLVSRLAISWVQFFPNSFVSTVSAVSDINVQFQNIEIEQDWLGFQLESKGLLVESEQFQFQADKLSADFNTFFFLLPSVNYGDYLEIEQGAFQLKQAAQGVTEVEAEESSQDLSSLFKFDLNIQRLWQRVALKNFVISEVIKPGLSIQLHDLQSLKGARLSLVTEFSLSYKEVLNYERFNFKSSFSPDVWGAIESGDFSLSSFKPLSIQRLAKLLPKRWEEVLPDGELILDLNGALSQSQLSSLALNLSGQTLTWRQQHDGLPRNAGLLLNWQAENQNVVEHIKDWRFTVSKMQIDNRYIDAVSPMELYFEDNQMLHFNAEYFDIEPFKVIVKALVKTELASKIFDRAAYLNISNLQGQLNWQSLDIPNLNIQFDRLDLPVTDFPGMSLRNLTIVKTPERVTFSTPKPVWVMAPEIYHKPMRLDLPKLLAFGYDEYSKVWTLPKLHYEVNAMPASLELSQISSEYIDGSFSLNVPTMRMLKKYLPYQYMSKNLEAWLTQSLLGGKDIAVQGTIRGLYKNFPFTEQNGQFIVKAKVKDAALKFNSEWPVLNKFDADISFSPFKIDIAVDKLNVGANVMAEDVLVVIPGIDQDNIALTVTGTVKSTLDKAVRYLTISPIADKLGMQDFLESGARFSGGVEVAIDQIWVPISGYEGIDERVTGKVKFNNSSVEFGVNDQLAFNKIKGQLKFTENVITANRLIFDLPDGKGELSVNTDRKRKQVLLSGSGHTLTAKNNWFAKPLPWQASVSIPFKSAKDKNIRLKLESNLAQGESLLPKPLDSLALQKKKLFVNALISDKFINSTVDIDGVAKASVSWQKNKGKQQFKAAQILLGKNLSGLEKLPKNSSFIKGQISELDIDQWLPIYKTLPFVGSDNEKPIEWAQSKITVDQVSYLSRTYPSLDISWRTRKNKPLNVILHSENVDGSLSFKDKDIVEFNVEYLKFFTGEDVEVEKSVAESSCEEVVQAKQLMPKVLFKGKNIFINERKIETLNFELSEVADSLKIENIEGVFGNKSGVIKGGYIYNKALNLSKLSAVMTSKKVEELTKFLKINRGFTGDNAQLTMSMEWPGELSCFATSRAKGSFDFKVSDGSIEDIEPGLARLIGLLSIESLVRRLKLNLEDVTNKGMVYDQIKGKAKLLDGKIQLEKLDLKAPSAQGVLKGSIDIEKQGFDLEAKITPKVGATIPTIAALAGSTNPLAALAVYTFMKVVPGINENLVTYEYDVTGTWDKPVIKSKQDLQVPKTDIEEDNILELQN